MSKLHQLQTPIFWAEGHPGQLDRQNWTIEVKGLCANPQVLTWNDLQNMPKTTADARLTSVTRFSVGGVWGGVKLADVLARVGVGSTCTHVRFVSVGLTYDTTIPIEIAQKERTLLAWEFDGELLDEDYGGPVRVFCPYLWGYKSAKSVVQIELLDHPQPGFWEQRGYPDEAEIEAGVVRDMNDYGSVKDIDGGEVPRHLKD